MMRHLCLLILLSITSFSIALAYSDQGYYYNDWTVRVSVSPDNTWAITESYDVTYTEARHGIYRYIQNEYGVNRNVSPDGEPAQVQYRVYRPKINVLHVGGDFFDLTERDENDCTVVRWGSASTWVEGPKSYSMEYTYQSPDDRISARDYIFHSLLPDNVLTYIEDFYFDVTFQKPLPADIADRLHIYCGPYGSERRAHVEGLQVTPTRISGHIRGIDSHQAVTLYAELPEGYYEGTFQTSSWPAYLCFCLAIVMALLLLYHELTDSRLEPVQTVEFYSPDDTNPILVGKIIDGSTDDIDIAALIPWLAQEGYISIREIPAEGGLFGKKADLELTKLQELPDDAPSYLKNTMTLLFCKGDVLLMNSIGDRHTKVTAVKSSVDNIFKGPKKLTDTRHGGLMLGVIATSTLAILFSSPSALIYADNCIGAAFWGISFIFAWMVRTTQAQAKYFTTPIMHLGVQLIRIVALAVILLIIYVGVLYEADNFFSLPAMATMMALCVAACELSGRNVHNTPYRNELIGRLLGFRQFIETAEKDRLQMLVDEDPSYFYRVLPFAMIFGMTDKWVYNFRHIEVQPAHWYHSHSAFNTHLFERQICGMSSQLTNAIKTTAVDHTRSRGSGRGGGGFSGGGGGGGGAGSW